MRPTKLALGDVECFWPECEPLEALTPTDTKGAMYRPLLQALLQISGVVGKKSRIIKSAGSKSLSIPF
jgi:hypothetical protein